MTDDHQAIRNLSYQYTRRVDEGDWAAVGETLAHATLRVVSRGMAGSELSGAAAIENFYRDQVVVDDQGRPLTRHLVTNHRINLDDDRRHAVAHSYFTVLQKPEREPLQIVVTGQYDDKFERIDDVWRFTSKTIRADYFGEIRWHFRISADQAG